MHRPYARHNADRPEEVKLIKDYLGWVNKWTNNANMPAIEIAIVFVAVFASWACGWV